MDAAGALLRKTQNELEDVKEKLEAEWELVKFMGQEENTELRAKLESANVRVAAAEGSRRRRGGVAATPRGGSRRLVKSQHARCPWTRHRSKPSRA